MILEDIYNLFDPEFYKKNNQDLVNMSLNELIYHYKNYGKKEGRFGSENQIKEYVEDNDFDIDFYKKNNPDLVNMSLNELINHYKNYGKKEGRFGSEKQIKDYVGDNDFDIDFYRKNNPDLNYMKKIELLNHYKNYGKKEGRFGSLKEIKDYVGDNDFDIDFYRKNNPDLNYMKKIELLNHYKNYGKKECRFGSEKQIKEYVGDNDFDIKIYMMMNPDLNHMSQKDLIRHYKMYGKKEGRFSNEKDIKKFVKNENFNIEMYRNSNKEFKNLNNRELIHNYKITRKRNFEKDYNITFYRNNCSSSLCLDEVVISEKCKTYLKDINEIDKFILIIDFPKLGGGTTNFLNNIINKYKYYQTFIIVRKYKEGIQLIINEENILEFSNKTYFTDEECINFFNFYKDKIIKIFINSILMHSESFIANMNIFGKEITYITHDYYILFDKPQPKYDEILNKTNLKSNILINNFDKIITQNINNLNIFEDYLNEGANVIVTELPDYKKSLNMYKTNYDKIIIGIIGYITHIKGYDIIVKLNEFIKSNNLNMEIIIFGFIKNDNIKNIYYKSINHLNELLIQYKPNVLIECSIWQETYSYTLTLAMITKLPIISFYKNYKYVINNRLENYDKTHFFNDINECISLINNYKQDYFYTIDPTVYFNSFWDNYFMMDDTSIKNLNEFKQITNNIDYSLNSKIHDIIEPYAIYFPQFHRIPENDKLFYKGYTDMENLMKIKYTNNLKDNILTPLKGVLDNYDIVLNENIINSQINLANKFGIKGFAFYHYWFDTNLINNNNDNNNIMENFTKQIINIKNENFSYFLIWANDKWCNELFNNYDYNEILIDKHFNNLIKYFNDTKYKKIDNKPFLAILHYYCWKIEIFNKYIDYLNKKCIENGFNGIYISCMTQHNLSLINNADAFYLNVPSWKNASMFGNVYTKNKTTYVDYNYYLENFENEILSKISKDKDIILNIFPNFDNYVRNYFKITMANYSYINCSTDNFDKYLSKVLGLTKKYKNNSKILLINSWNEWGENMAIEPSNELKYSYLEIIYKNLKNILK